MSRFENSIIQHLTPESHMRATMVTLLVCLAGAWVVAEEKSPYHYHSYLNEKPPELTSQDEHWHNAAAALTLEKLHGRPVWLEFNF